MHPALRVAISRAFFALHRPRSGMRAIFYYHSVGSGSPLAQPVAAFTAQVRYLARWFRVVRLSEFLDAADAGGNLAAVTFDDGYADNAGPVRDILERWGIPGTFFVVTGYLGRELPTSGGPFRLMTAADVKSLAAAGHEVGAHTVTHPSLPALPAEEVRYEVAESKRFLEELLGQAVTSFAYPKGAWNGEIRRAVEAAGYRQAVTTRRGFVAPPLDPLTLPRLAVRDYVAGAVR